MDYLYVPRNRWGGYNVSLRITRVENGYKVYVYGYELDQATLENVSGPKVRGGYDFGDLLDLLRTRGANRFPIYAGRVIIHKQEGDEVKFVCNGERMRLGELIEFLDNHTDFQKYEVETS